MTKKQEMHGESVLLDLDLPQPLSMPEFRDLFELMPFPVTVSRYSDGRFLLVNHAFCQNTGYNREEALGNTPAEMGIYANPEDQQRLRQALQEKGEVQDFKLRHQDRTGQPFYNKLSARLIRFQGLACLLSITVYGTPLKNARRALKESESRFHDILESITEGYYEVDLSGKLTFFNHALITILGYSNAALRGKDYRDYVSPETADRLYKAYNDVYATGGAGKIVHYDIIRRDGSRGSVETSVNLRRGRTGDPIGFYGVVRDRTEQKKVEKAIARSEESHRNLLEMAPDGITVGAIPDWRYLQVNDTFCRKSGYSPGDVIGRTPLELNLFADPSEALRIGRRLRSTGRVDGLEIIFQGRDGSHHPHLFSARTIRYKGQDAWVGIVTDLTSLKKAQLAKAASEERIHHILEEMEEGYYEVDLQGNYVYFNESTRQHHGYPADELMGMNYAKFLAPGVIKEARRRFINIYKTGKPEKIFDYQLLRKDGSTCLIEMSTYPKKDANGNTIGFWGISRDRTERKRSEIALQESEERMRSIFENASEGIYVTRKDRIKFVNPKTAEITGYSASELMNRPFAELVYPEDREGVYQAQQSKTESDRSDSVFSFRILNRVSGVLWVELSTVPINWEGRPATVNFLRDVTPQRKMEAQLLQAKKMEAVGTLAGGIAHDFNNLLMGIQGNASLALMSAEKGQPLFQKLKNIEQYVKAGADLTRQLLATARGGKYEVKPTLLNQVVSKSAELFGRTKKEISIHRQFQKRLHVVEVDRGQIEQVLLNLFVNAWQAMPNGGDLYLTTQNVFLGDEEVKPYDIPAGNYVKLSVADNGEGIDPDDLKRIFDPFFTTKGMQRGTGLGLASAYGIISNHGGMIAVRSQKGQGATFDVFLPASRKSAVGNKGPVKDIMTGHETILLVDDEEGILEVGHGFLDSLGYQVVGVPSGREAVSVYRQKKDSIDLVILDMILPGMSGSDTFAALQAVDPAVKVILASGYSLDGQAKGLIDRGCAGFIQKPFNLQALSIKLREILDNGV